MRAIGSVLTLLAVAIIAFNVFFAPAYNEQQMNENPWTTVLSGGENLQKAYTFRPPLSSFELFVYGMALVGGLIVLFGKKAKP